MRLNSIDLNGSIEPFSLYFTIFNTKPLDKYLLSAILYTVSGEMNWIQRLA